MKVNPGVKVYKISNKHEDNLDINNNVFPLVQDKERSNQQWPPRLLLGGKTNLQNTLEKYEQNTDFFFV